MKFDIIFFSNGNLPLPLHVNIDTTKYSNRCKGIVVSTGKMFFKRFVYGEKKNV